MFIVPLTRVPVVQWELGRMDSNELIRMLEGDQNVSNSQ
jgi:hypothetical protein